jgi:hypothetical protein
VKLHRELLHCLVLVALVLPVAADDKISDQDLQNEYGGKVLTLRQRYWGPKLQFDASGSLVGSGEIGPWTVAGQVRVRDITVKNGAVRIRGQRLFLFYDPASKTLRDAGTLAKDDPARKLFRVKIDEWAAKAGKVEIGIETGAAEPTMVDVTRSINAVFLASGEALTDAVPVYWRKWLDPKSVPPQDRSAADESSKTVYRIGGGVLPPHVKYNPDPPYSNLAREAGYQGTTLFSLVAGEDGVPRHIRVFRPLGMGLDEEAERVVETWRFDPATKDGKPVPAALMVEVNFRLY